MNSHQCDVVAFGGIGARMNHDCIKIEWKFDRRTARRKFG
jgi:hypothetical protein